MREITATNLARRLKEVLNDVTFREAEYRITRNKQKIARILPEVHEMTALEAMADLYRTLPEGAAKGWLKDSRLPEKLSVKNRWDS